MAEAVESDRTGDVFCKMINTVNYLLIGSSSDRATLECFTYFLFKMQNCLIFYGKERTTPVMDTVDWETIKNVIAVLHHMTQNKQVCSNPVSE